MYCHVLVVCCRFEDVTLAEALRLNPKACRVLLLYGHLLYCDEMYCHVLVVCCRFEDVTLAEPLRLNPKADRDLLLYGYLRGAPLRQGARLHLAGVGDFDLQASPILF
jgi:hypothetical protein